MFAALNGHVEIVRYLIQAGVNINAMALNGGTALILAALNGHLEVVRYLIQAGANINAPDLRNSRAALISAALNGHVEVVRYLIQAGANINATDLHGGTALMCATQNGHVATTLVLLNAGANKAARNIHGWSAFDIACDQANQSMLFAFASQELKEQKNKLRSTIESLGQRRQIETSFFHLPIEIQAKIVMLAFPEWYHNSLEEDMQDILNLIDMKDKVFQTSNSASFIPYFSEQSCKDTEVEKDKPDNSKKRKHETSCTEDEEQKPPIKRCNK